jgi:hypothetical protein
MRLPNVAIILALVAALSRAALAQSVEPGSISHGCSGGFTGGGGGVTVRSDGTILRWSRPTYRGAIEETVIRSDPAAARELFAQIDGMKFTNIHYNKAGNMTCQVVLRRGSTTHAVAWEPGDPSSPPRVLALASRLQHLGLPDQSN